MPAPLTSDYHGYSLGIELVLTATSARHTLFQDTNLKIDLIETDVELTYAGNSVRASCSSFSRISSFIIEDLNKGLLLAVVVKKSSTSTTLTTYWDTKLCSTQVVNSAFSALTTATIGSTFKGVMRRILILKAVLGQESFLNYTPSRLISTLASCNPS